VVATVSPVHSFSDAHADPAEAGRRPVMKMLAAKNPEKLIDLLHERLTFERTSVKLYDRVLSLMATSNDSQVRGMLDTMQAYRDEEAEHQAWLEEQIQALGGDVNAETELSRLVAEEARGIEQVILSQGVELPHLFHALMAAELVDNAGWDLLAALAEEADDDEALDALTLRQAEEEDHLEYLRQTMARYAENRVLGEELQLPTEP
jgi:bacterioferritin (cytochrome b1)